MAAAWARWRRTTFGSLAVFQGEAEAILGVGVGGDDLGGEQGLGGVGRAVADDRRHRGFVAHGVVCPRCRRRAAASWCARVEHVQGGGRREVRQGRGGVHGGCWGWGDVRSTWVLVMMSSIVIYEDYRGGGRRV